MITGSGLGLPAAVSPHVEPALRVAVVAPPGVDAQRVRNVVERAGCAVIEVEVDGRATPDAAVVVANPPLAESVCAVVRSLGEVPVVVVTRANGPAAVEEALNAGASGFVSEGEIGTRLGATVHAVAAGQLTVPFEHRGNDYPTLSRREKQVLSMVVLGFSNIEIAGKLHVTVATVKSHLSSAYRKLGVGSRHAATDLILSDRRLGLGILTLSGEHAPG